MLLYASVYSVTCACSAHACKSSLLTYWHILASRVVMHAQIKPDQGLVWERQ